jgi:hypothetical protein
MKNFEDHLMSLVVVVVFAQQLKTNFGAAVVVELAQEGSSKFD